MKWYFLIGWITGWTILMIILGVVPMFKEKQKSVTIQELEGLIYNCK